jgi:hypothetical protein
MAARSLIVLTAWSLVARILSWTIFGAGLLAIILKRLAVPRAAVVATPGAVKLALLARCPLLLWGSSFGCRLGRQGRGRIRGGLGL